MRFTLDGCGNILLANLLDLRNCLDAFLDNSLCALFSNGREFGVFPLPIGQVFVGLLDCGRFVRRRFLFAANLLQSSVQFSNFSVRLAKLFLQRLNPSGLCLPDLPNLN